MPFYQLSQAEQRTETWLKFIAEEDTLESRVVEVLKKYRADDDPHLKKLKGQELSTLSKEEIIKVPKALK